MEVARNLPDCTVAALANSVYGDAALDPLASKNSGNELNQLFNTVWYVIATVSLTSSDTAGVKATSTTTRASTPVGAKLGG